MNPSSEETIIDRIAAASPRAEISAAIEGDYITAGIISDTYADNLLGSRLFNVATAAMGVLRREPRTPLVEKAIEVPENTAAIGAYTLDILNRSMKIKGDKNTLNIKVKNPLPEQQLSIDHEKWLIEATDEANDPEQEPNLLLIDEKGDPVLFQSPETTINLKKIRINHIPYAPGTLFDLIPEQAMTEAKHNNTRIALAKRKNIVSAAALRFSIFAFSPQERLPILFQPGDSALDQIAIPEKILDYTLINLQKKLPSKEIRQTAARILRPRA